MMDQGFQHETTERYHLNRFVQAEEPHDARALSEIRNAQKRSHGMWYRSATRIFGSPDDLKLRSCTTLFEGVSTVREITVQCPSPLVGEGRVRGQKMCQLFLERCLGIENHLRYG